MGRHRVVCQFTGGIKKAEVAANEEQIIPVKQKLEDEVGRAAVYAEFVPLDPPEEKSLWDKLFGK